MKKILVVVLLLVTYFSQAQLLNDYNMAIIPAKFNFQDSDNQYRINYTIKSFLQSKGFEAYVNNEILPEGFNDYNCNKVFVDVAEENTMFSTKIKVIFKDCKNNILFTTDLGESREKDLPKAYNFALQAALKSFSKANYVYNGKTYFDEEAQEKIKSREVVNVTEQALKVEKNEAFTKVLNKISGKEMILYRTSKPSTFLANYNGKSGVVVNKGAFWFFEFLDGDKVVSEKLDIKL